jgi:glutathione S-transferase
VHVGAFRPINRPERYSADEAAFPGIRQRALEQLTNALKPIEARLAQSDYLVGNSLTLADIYLGVFLGWSARVGVLGDFPALQAALGRFRARESVVQTASAEGLA